MLIILTSDATKYELLVTLNKTYIDLFRQIFCFSLREIHCTFHSSQIYWILCTWGILLQLLYIPEHTLIN